MYLLALYPGQRATFVIEILVCAGVLRIPRAAYTAEARIILPFPLFLSFRFYFHAGG